MRVGQGFDVHAFDASRPLILGGVRLDGPGLAGHSDADVLTHAIADALLGAAALGDLGTHFPDTDEQWRDASSLVLLERVAALVRADGHVIASIDATVVLEAPRLASHIAAMRTNVASALGVDIRIVSVKATTSERLGAIGRGEGAACLAVALLDG